MSNLYSKRLILTIGVVLVLLAGVLSTHPEIVRAHADYDRSDPPANAVIPEPPAEVHVWFTQELFRREGANNLVVVGPDGEQVDQGDARIDDDDRTHMIVSLQEGLPNGMYTVQWQTLSADDGDSAEGEFIFTVDPEAVHATPPPSPQPSPDPPTPSPTPAPSPTPTPPASGGLACLSGIIFGGLGLIVIAPRWRQ